MVDLDPAPFLHNRCAFGRGRTRRFQKALIVGNTAVLSLSSPFPSPQVRRLWSHPNAAVFLLVVDLVGLLSPVAVEIRARPAGIVLRISGTGRQARLLRRLR